ncbi:acyltransferase family protein [Paenibacillus aurantius]|uniref:Acyltransferase family protein n=1 Tax=Paenibacillus aurantius TaxID=2918900 RepID=A0AA96RGB1_9BACL|nr:acyltransferase family protein [Paenibacillus aurantius]WNQ12341.1 acyltransferase family protein [Paenibacillus aurantius]
MAARLQYLDRLKVVLTMLVVFHHTAITYGGAGSWYYIDPAREKAAEIVLTLFTAVNQSFFMGLFFFISGYVTPASFDRKGAGRFLKERVVRFGLPLLGFMLVIDPLLRFVSGRYPGSFASYWKEEVLADPLAGVKGFETGPLWFLTALLLFSAVYALRRLAAKGRPARVSRLTGRRMAAYLAAVAAANFAIRLVYPVGETVLNLQLAYFPAYIGLYAGGIAAYRGRWLEALQASAAKRWGRLALVLMAGMPGVLALGGALESGTPAFGGGWTWQAAFYAAVDPLLGLSLSYVLLFVFRERFNQPARLRSSWLSEHAYTVYLLHALFVTYIGYAFTGLSLPALLKFAAAGGAAVLCSYTAAWALRRVPGAKRVL